jgi:hypothetical protein
MTAPGQFSRRAELAPEPPNFICQDAPWWAFTVRGSATQKNLLAYSGRGHAPFFDGKGKSGSSVDGL